MPKRKRITRYESDEIQGEGSWVRIGTLTVEEMRESRKDVKKKDHDPFELGVKVIANHVFEWNWVDDNGEPMPQVPECPEIVDKLTDDEIGFLALRIQGTDTEVKN